MFRNMTVSQKLGLGFASVTFVLILCGTFSFIGIGGIVNNAKEVIYGNVLDGTMAQREVDHLNWVNKLNALLTDQNITTLDIQTDPTRCTFGKWLYSEERMVAEKRIPSLTPILKEIEASHKKLHESAVNIDHAFEQPHTGLNLQLSQQLIDHLKWMNTLNKTYVDEVNGLGKYQEMTQHIIEVAISHAASADQNAELLDEQAKKDYAKQVIRNLRYGPEQKDYVFIIDENPTMVMHPYKPELEGKDLTESKDQKGNFLFRDMVNVTKKAGEGFVTYYWPLPGSDQICPKLSYVKVYEPWGWILGTGVYLDHTDKNLLRRADEFAQKKPFTFGINTDPAKSEFGRFLNSAETKKLKTTFPEFAAAIDKCRVHYEKMYTSAMKLEKHISNRDYHQASAIYENETMPALTSIEKYLNDIINTETKIEEGFAKANEIYAKTTLPSLKHIQSNLADLREIVKNNIMTQDVMLDSARNTKRKVGIVMIWGAIMGSLLSRFISKGIIRTMTHIIDLLSESSTHVAVAAGQVSCSSQQLAEVSSEQAASIEEVSSSLQEISQKCNESTQLTKGAQELMNRNIENSGQSLKSIVEMTRKMSEIEADSGEMATIIKNIDEIAFQTNLLALNAAVEAARAGEHGKGFAVVAEEVRNLALRAADAAKGTQDLLDNTVKKVADTAHSIRGINDNFEGIVESATVMGDKTQSVTNACVNINDGVQLINKAAGQVSQSTQSIAANAEESASASEELSTQAEHLNEAIEDLIIMIGGKAKERLLKQKAEEAYVDSDSYDDTDSVYESETEINLENEYVNESSLV